MTKKSKKKRQHYVPRFFFRFHSVDGKRIDLLVRSSGKIVRNASIREQCAESYFYGPALIEDLFADLEALHADAFEACRQIRSVDQLTFENQRLIRQGILFLRARTRLERERMTPFQDKMLRMHLEVEIHNDPSLSEERRKELLENLPSISFDRKSSHGQHMVAALTSPILVEDMALYILENKTDTPFVFSDAPVVLHNPLCQNVKLCGVLGLQTPGLVILCPISPQRTLMLIDDDRYEGPHKLSLGLFEVRNEEDAVLLNRIQMLNANEVVYFGDHSMESGLLEMWTNERALFDANRIEINEAPGYDENGKYMGMITHSFEPLLPITPDLSFLQYTPIQEEEYRIQHRTEKLVRHFQEMRGQAGGAYSGPAGGPTAAHP